MLQIIRRNPSKNVTKNSYLEETFTFLNSIKREKES